MFEVPGELLLSGKGTRKWWCLAEMEAQRGVRKHLPMLGGEVLHRSVSRSGIPWGELKS